MRLGSAMFNAPKPVRTAMNPPAMKSRPTSSELSPTTGIRTGLSAADLKQSFLDNLLSRLARLIGSARHRLWHPL